MKYSDLPAVGSELEGSRNDREWNKVAEGRTLREVIDAVMKDAL